LAWVILGENLSIQLMVSAGLVLFGVSVHVVPLAFSKPITAPQART
jgi:hypothetical protein